MNKVKSLLSIWRSNERLRRARFVDWLEFSRLDFLSHPLGFVQAKLKEEGDEYRLNIWSDSIGRRKTPDWQVHNHSFSFISYIVLGALQEVRFERRNGTGWFDYFVDYDDAGSSLKPGPTTSSLIEIERKIYRAGDVYRIDAEEVHSTVAMIQPSVTLMHIGPRVQRSPAVFGTAIEEVAPYAVQSIPTQAVVCLFDEK